MSVGLTILLTLAAWALGPLILRAAGGLLTTCALVLWAVPMETHTSTVALAFTAITGAAMWHTGSLWQARRDTTRITGYPTLTLQQLIARGIARSGRARSERDEREFASDQVWQLSRRDPYRTAHVDLQDEDIIEGVAYDVEPESGW
jgi:hypothetical protein